MQRHPSFVVTTVFCLSGLFVMNINTIRPVTTGDRLLLESWI